VKRKLRNGIGGSIIGKLIKFELEPHNRNMPDSELIADLKRVANELQKNSVAVSEYNTQGRFDRFHVLTLDYIVNFPYDVSCVDERRAEDQHRKDDDDGLCACGR
jgi:hypothetical protein